MQKQLLRILLTVLLFFFVYNPPLVFFPVNAGILIAGAFFIFLLVKLIVHISFSKEVVINKKVLTVVGLTILTAGYAFFIAYANSSGHLQLFKSYMSFLLFYIPGAFGIVSVFKPYFDSTDFIQSFITITVVQAIIVVAMFVNPDIKDLFFSLLRDADSRIIQNNISHGFRFLGFAFGGSWDLSIVQSLGILLMVLLIRLDKRKVNFSAVLIFLLLLVSVVLAGRTGIVGILIAIILLAVPVSLKEIPFFKIAKFSTLLFIILIPLYFFIRQIIPPAAFNIIEDNVLPWALEMFQNDSGPTLETKSSNELKTMYFMPPVKTVLIGDGMYINPADPNRYYMDTDAGYMRHLLFYGIPGSFLVYFLFIVVFAQMYTCAGALGGSPVIKWFVVLLGIYYFLSHGKGDLMGGSNMPLKSIFLLYAIFICFDQKKEDEKN